MLIDHFPALLTLFPRTCNIKSNANNGRNVLSSPVPVKAFINEEATGLSMKDKWIELSMN